MNADKLFINNSTYTVENLDHLPEKLRLENVSSRTIDEYLFFFSRNSPLSNYKEAKFFFNGKNYLYSEQYIQEKKAILANAPEVAREVLQASDPGHMKSLTRNLPGHNTNIWEENV